MKYRVYTQQVNADVFEVEAETRPEAISEAEKQWNDSYGFEIRCVEED